jgi:ATP-dependent helicase HrpA
LAATLAPVEEQQEQAFESIRTWVTGRPVEPADAATFAAVLEHARGDLRGVVPRLTELLREILNLRLELQVMKDAPAAVNRQLTALLPADFLRVTPFARLSHLPRYLKAMRLRVDRARRNPAKDAEREAQVAVLEESLRRLSAKADAAEVSQVRWLLEELRVSFFAQELGTAEPVSAVKLERRLVELRAAAGGGAVSAVSVPAKPIVAATVRPAGPKPAPVKSLGALDRLLGQPKA